MRCKLWSKLHNGLLVMTKNSLGEVEQRSVAKAWCRPLGEKFEKSQLRLLLPQGCAFSTITLKPRHDPAEDWIACNAEVPVKTLAGLSA